MNVGTTLFDARVAAGLSLDELADKCKLRATILAAMESGDFSHCGGFVYARGQLRAIAPLLNLDPEALVDAFAVEVESGLHGSE
ncbi:unannotated protein [freshwater metagenome]|uniref:Unannotated protein n=1 Tax=freshwater metagenome TaxID=449393 RepID=A0A6J6IJX5_9ZZZZ|nr:hypothetical protein [Actinomycetota bacterium]MSY38994.1 hypothetical protein [Actinomycetota bacterium]MSZ41712.1 hypothetical protein [Actinomycetota bacterium]